MLKGVNKTVIEINCTDHGYFEKAILFVNPEQSHTSQKRLEAEALKYIDLLSEQVLKPEIIMNKRVKSRNKRLLILLTAMLFIACGGLFIVLNFL